jgi:succinate-acetate transporter protein
MAQIAVEHADAAASTHANPAPLGLGAFALTTFVLSVANASIIPSSDHSFLGLAFFGGLALLLAGFWEFRSRNTLNATAFTLYGAFWLSYGYGVITSSFTGAGLGYYFLAWAILSFVFLLGSLRTHGVLIAVFLFFTLTSLTLAIGRFADSSNWQHIGGWLGIITAILAGYAALADILRSEKSALQLPTFPMS